MAIKANGQIPSEHIDALIRLRKLIELYDKSERRRKRLLLPAALAICVTLFIISSLLFLRVSETSVEVDLFMTEVHFTLSNQQILFDFMQLDSIGVSGIKKIHFPRTFQSEKKLVYSSDQSGLSARLKASSFGDRKGTITLSALVIPARTKVNLHITRPFGSFRLSLEAEEILPLRVQIDGPVNVLMSDRPPEKLDFVSPTSILFEPGLNAVDIDISLTERAPSHLSKHLMVEKISFLGVHQLVEPDRTVAGHISGILSGVLYQDSLNGKMHKMRAAEVLQFENSKGEIRNIQWETGKFQMNFHGNVNGMETGSGDYRRSIMPTYLEYLKSNHNVSLFWGAAIYLFGLIIAALRWWGISV